MQSRHYSSCEMLDFRHGADVTAAGESFEFMGIPAVENCDLRYRENKAVVKYL